MYAKNVSTAGAEEKSKSGTVMYHGARNAQECAKEERYDHSLHPDLTAYIILGAARSEMENDIDFIHLSLSLFPFTLHVIFIFGKQR